MPKNPSETGRQCTVAKVRNWIGEGTFAGARSNDEDAPIPVIRRTAIERPKSTSKAADMTSCLQLGSVQSTEIWRPVTGGFRSAS